MTNMSGIKLIKFLFRKESIREKNYIIIIIKKRKLKIIEPNYDLWKVWYADERDMNDLFSQSIITKVYSARNVVRKSTYTLV